MTRVPIVYLCFPGGKYKVVTTSFDDGRMEDYQLVELFNKYGIKGTFNLNAGIVREDRLPASDYKRLYEGHEIAAHTFTHPTISRCPLELVAQEVIEDRKGLEALCGYPVRGLAYPNGSYSKEIMKLLPALGIRYARTVRSTMSFALPTEYTEWDPTCHFRHDLARLTDDFVKLHKKQYSYLFYVWGHSYELPENNGWEMLENFCKTVSEQDDIWFATNIEIVDYLEAAKQLQYMADMSAVYNPNFASIWLSLDGETVEVPGGRTVSLRH